MIVQGEAGVGKSRLIAELASEALNVDCRVLLGRCHEAEQILPFGPWVDALRTGRIEAVGSPRSLLPAWRTELARLLPELRPGVPDPDSSVPDRLKLFEAVTELLCHLTARQPVVLILEDLHWADEMTLRLLTFLIHRLEDRSMLVVSSAREEDLTDVPMLRSSLEELGREAHVARLALGPLSHAATVDLVRMLTRSGREKSDLVQLGEEIWRTSEGNPFVLVETMRALDQGVLTPGTASLSLPQRVREVIARRLDRLSERSRQLVAVAAVIGREFEFSLLQRAAEIDEREAAEGIEELVRRHVLRGVGECFDFSHHRVQTVVYDQLLRPQRRLRHRHVGEALEALYASNLEPHYLALGGHFREGAAWGKAVKFFRQAGLAAVERSAYRQAAALFEEALAALGHLLETRETLTQAVDLHLEARHALYPLGEIVSIFNHLRRPRTWP